MSAKMTIKTNMKQADQIIGALIAMGVPEDQIQHAPEGVEVSGYRGKSYGEAQILIPKKWHGGYGDVGFAQQSDGTYQAVMDDLDNYRLCRKLQVEVPKGAGFASLTGQWYAATAAKRALRQQGFRAKIKQDGPNLRVLAQQY